MIWNLFIKIIFFIINIQGYYNQSDMWMNFKTSKHSLSCIALIASIMTIASSIYIPLSGTVPRCMIVYSVGESETVKVDINFPTLENQQPTETYQLSWTNTETNQTTLQRIPNGKFRKELNLVQNIIYDLCIKVVSRRDYGTTLVEYSSHNIFAVNQAAVKVPENLLKEEHITQAFLSAADIETNIDAYEIIQENRTNTHAEVFRKTNKISLRLVQISIGELVLIILASAYQFWAISKYLKSKSGA